MSNDDLNKEELKTTDVPVVDGALEEEIMGEELVEPEVVSETVEESAAESDEVKPVTVAHKYKYTNPNVTMTYNPRGKMPEGKEDTRETLGIVSLSGTELSSFVNQQSFKANVTSLDDVYLKSLQDGAVLTFNDDVIQNAVDAGSEYGQNVQYEDKTLHATVPSYKAGSGDTLTGIKAIAQIQRALKQGSFLNFPCWASGVWITLRAPTTFELADYYDAVAEEIIELGKKTTGAIYGNTSVYLSKYMIDLVEKLVYDCSIKNFSDGTLKLRDILMVDELQTIAWALAVCMYPNGYPFEEPCTVDLEKCNKTYKTLLNISKMYWVDKKRLTNWQIQFMSNKTTKRSIDEINKYQAEADWLQSESVGYDGFKIIVKTPTIGEHIDSGYRWIADIEQSIRATINNLSDSKLNSLIMERAGLTLLRSYGHYIKAFVYDDGSTVNTKLDIDATINNLCTSPDVVSKFTEDLQKHITSSTISMIAIPRYKCPDCGGDNHVEEQTHPHLIPIDGAQLFFVLRDQKLQLA